MQITEPTTMLTDYLLALFTAFLAYRLWKIGLTNQQNSIRLWAGAFIATVIAAIVGGTSHGFTLYLNELAKVVFWKTTVNAIGFASFFMLAGTIIASISGRLKRWLLILAFIQLLLYIAWMIFHNDFKYVIFDYVPAMLAIVVLQIYAFYSRGDKSAVWIIAGISLSFVGAGIQLSGFTIHQHFNNNDLYHVIQMGANYLLYRGAGLFRDQGETS